VSGSKYPDAVDPGLVGTYPALAKSGGGYVWDEVLEYRAWCHPERGAPDEEQGNDYYHAFATYAEALAFSQQTVGAEPPLALIRQLEYISEPEPGVYLHIKEPRVAEWPVKFLSRPRRTKDTIPAFFAPDAPANRLDILRGIAAHNEDRANDDRADKDD
jgi:putative acetyltransferase